MIIRCNYGVETQKSEYQFLPVWTNYAVGAPTPVPPIPPVPPVDPDPDALAEFDVNLFLGDAAVGPNHGMAPLEVNFAPGNPYDIIIEVDDNFYYIILEDGESGYIISEEPL